MAADDAYEAELASLRRAFAANLRSLREPEFHSQEAFAQHARLHRTTVGKLEQAHRDPPLSTLLILADALNVPVERLIAGLAVPQERRPPPALRGRRRGRASSGRAERKP